MTELADKDCIALTCGYYHSLALSVDRCVWAWGWGVHGQLGFGNIEDYLVPARVTTLDRCGVIRLAAGYSHTAVLTAEVYSYTVVKIITASCLSQSSWHFFYRGQGLHVWRR